MAASLEVYGVMKVSGKDKGLDEARRNLASRFRVSTRSDGTTPKDGSAD